MLLSGPLVTALLKRPIQSIAECTGHVPISLSGRKTYYAVSQCRYNSTSITDRYQSLVANDKLQPDHHQLEVVKRLQQLQDELKDYTPPGNQPYWINKIFNRNNKSTIRGLYMYGTVGAGKTMLMDMFYKTTKVKKKQRLHFNEFMMDAHKRIHKFKQNLPKLSNERRPRSYDPISPVAHDISANVHLLCFDEFQVTDIGDAMILKRLFTALFDDGVVVIATSNRPPDDLYKHGLQRGNFLPFIDILKKNCSIVKLSPDIDYRQSIISTVGGIYMNPNSVSNNNKLEKIFLKFSEEQGNIISPRRLEFFGRHLHVNKTAGKIAFFTFNELCNQPLSAIDFLELCRAFEIVFVTDIPRMTMSMRSQAKRFITLIDTLYDHKVKLICTANGSPVELFLQPSVNTSNGTMSSDEERALMDDLGIDQMTASQTSIFTGEEERFAFIRTVSRLQEMQGDDYWNTDHIPPR